MRVMVLQWKSLGALGTPELLQRYGRQKAAGVQSPLSPTPLYTSRLYPLQQKVPEIYVALAAHKSR